MSQYNRQGGGPTYPYDQYAGDHYAGSQQHYTDHGSQSGYPPEAYQQQYQGHPQQQSHSGYQAAQPEYQSAPVKPQR